MNVSALIGNENIKSVLSHGLSCQSFIIEGETGSGRHTLANILAAAAVCHAEDNAPCGRCEACRKVQAGAHIDVIAVPSDSKTEDLRHILESVSVYPNEGRKKVYIIDEAEKMGVIQQNVLLKTLEEPPEYAVFLLICVTREGLLPTIRSRCMTLSLEPLDDETVRGILVKQFGETDTERLDRAVSLGKGRLGIALNEYGNVKSDLSEKCERAATCAVAEDYAGLLGILSAEKDRNGFRELITGMREWFNLRLIEQTKKGENGASVRLAAFARTIATLEEKASLNVNLTLWSTAVVRACYGINNAVEKTAENRRKQK